MVTIQALTNYRADHPGDVLELHELTPDQTKAAIVRLAELSGSKGIAPHAIFSALSERSSAIPWNEFNLDDSSNTIDEAFRRTGVYPAGQVLAWWSGQDNIDCMSFSCLCDIFDYVWCPGRDDAVFFDDAAEWAITIHHSGCVQVLKKAALES